MFKKGMIPWNKGLTAKDDSRIKAGDDNPAKRPDVREKISDSKRGDKNPSKKEWVRKILSESHKGKHLGSSNGNYKGRTVERICIGCGILFFTNRDQKYHDLKCYHDHMDHHMENNTRWKGGISFEPYCPKFNNEFKVRVRAFFGYECILCSKSEQNCSSKLCVHHVEYNKKACCDGKPVHFAALCRSCHSKTNGDRQRWEDIIHRIIDEIYNGRSYYTKEEYDKKLEKL